MSPLHTALVPSAQDDVPSAQRLLPRVRRVLFSSAHRASLLCTERTSRLHRARVPPAHGLCQRHAGSRTAFTPLGFTHSHKKRSRMQPQEAAELLAQECTQDPSAPAPLGARRGCTVTSDHLGKRSWAFLRGIKHISLYLHQAKAPLTLPLHRAAHRLRTLPASSKTTLFFFF